MTDDKLKEFREKNIALMREVEVLKHNEAAALEAAKQAEANEAATLRDARAAAAAAAAAADALTAQHAVDLDALKVQLAAGGVDPEDIVALKLELATEKGKAASAQAKADRGVLREKLRDKLLAAGVLPAALDIALDKAEPAFTITGDVVTAKPGGPLNVEEFILSATTEFPFLFAPSRGGGSSPKASVLGARSNANVLRDPSPQQLGQHAADIKSGKMKVEFTNS